MKTKTINLYTFEELSDEAKDRARTWYRDDGGDSFQWQAESVLEDAATITELFGLDINNKPVLLMGGGTRYDPEVYYDLGRASYAAFVGTYRYKAGALKGVKAYAPLDTELHRIVEELQKAQKKQFYKLIAHCTYHHYYGFQVEVEHADDNYRDITEAAEGITEALRDFASWIYKQLCRAEEWAYSDEYVDEGIIANEYTFTEDGRIEL